MQPNLKKILRALSLDIRHTLEGSYDNTGIFHPGDLETRLNALGVWRDRHAKPLAELPHLSSEDKAARQVIDAYIAYRAEAEVSRADAVAEFVRESAYNWANRLLALRCMEARGIIDEVILQKEVYGGRSLMHNRLARKNPEACAGSDEGLFAVLFQEFEVRSRELPELFAPESPAIVLRPSLPALKHCIALLSGTERANGQESAMEEVFSSPDALGWAYQYWNSEEKDRVFEKVRTQKSAKIEGADIIPATQLYTEPYMVKFLIQNSLGATWMELHPDSTLSEGWEYYVTGADRTPVGLKAMEEITLLDPACGSGHFLLEAFDLFFRMYKEEHIDWGEDQIAAAILNYNLYGIDIDERAVQIAAAALWMKAKEYAPDLQSVALTSFHQHLVATNIHLPKDKDHLKAFLAKHPEAAPLQPALEAIFEGLENVHELGSLVQIEEPVEKELRYLREKFESSKKRGIQARLFEPTEMQGELPIGIESYDQWKTNTLAQLELHFVEENEAFEPLQAFFGVSVQKGLALFEMLSRRYHIVTANPPYMHNRNMGSSIRSYLKPNYPLSFSDLYTAFITRCSQLTQKDGIIAMVCQQTYMFLSSYGPLRDFLLLTHHFVLTCVLGSGAFSEISGEKVNVNLQLISKSNFENRQSLFLDVHDNINKSEAIKSTNIWEHNKYFIEQSDFRLIEDSPFVYWLNHSVRKLFKEKKLEDGGALIKGGISTTNNLRFLRFFWEVNDQERWFSYRKGGGFCRWYGNSSYVVDWEGKGTRLKTLVTENFGNPGKHLRNFDLFFSEGLTYSLMCGSGFSVRFFLKECAFDNSGPGIFSQKYPLHILSVYLNSTLVRYLTKILNPTISVQTGDIGRLPQPNSSQEFSTLCEMISQNALDEKKKYISTFLTEDLFVKPPKCHLDILNHETNLAIIAGFVDEAVLKYHYLQIDQIQDILNVYGRPYTTMPMIEGYDSSNSLNQNLNIMAKTIHNNNENIELLVLKKEELQSLRKTLYEQFMHGSYVVGINNEVLTEENENNLIDQQSSSSVFFESLIEEFSAKLSIHPVSLYLLIKEGIEKDGWRCLPEERRITEDRYSVIILCLLGHRWPKQIEDNEPVPDWADPDGIIPLTAGLQESMLFERVRVRLLHEFPGGNAAALEREFAEIMGEDLEKWLNSSFFKHHISQFKKRPIAWQLSSRPANGTGGKGKNKGLDKTPAFFCLVYYHKLDHNTLTTLQSQYVRPLRQSYETELRTLDNSPFLTPDQASRRIQLEAWIDELKDFESRLEQCAREGFASPKLKDISGNESLDRWTSRDGQAAQPANHTEFETQEMRYDPDINDGVRVNIAPLQKYGLLAADVLDAKDIEKAIADRAEWRADERRWCRDGKLPQPGWWKQ